MTGQQYCLISLPFQFKRGKHRGPVNDLPYRLSRVGAGLIPLFPVLLAWFVLRACALGRGDIVLLYLIGRPLYVPVLSTRYVTENVAGYVTQCVAGYRV